MIQRTLFTLIFLLFLLAACNSGGENDLSRMGTPLVTRGVLVTTGPTPQAVVPGETPEPTHAPEISVLASGEFDLPTADFSVTHTLPDDLDMGADMRLVLTLRDVNRPDQTCAEHHPQSGCATVDWSDENTLTLKLESGTNVFFLSASGALADEPDEFNPDCAYTAVGGSAQAWSVDLSEAIEPGSDLELSLVMTKSGAPDVRIGYEIRVEDSSEDALTSGGGC